MRLVSLIPLGTKIDFMRFRKMAGSSSIAMAILSIVFFLVLGLNYGIDFRGGILSVWYADGVGRVRIRGYASDLRQHDYVLVDYHVQ